MGAEPFGFQAWGMICMTTGRISPENVPYFSTMTLEFPYIRMNRKEVLARRPESQTHRRHGAPEEKESARQQKGRRFFMPFSNPVFSGYASRRSKRALLHFFSSFALRSSISINVSLVDRLCHQPCTRPVRPSSRRKSDRQSGRPGSGRGCICSCWNCRNNP
jgi:hypothetical protein